MVSLHHVWMYIERSIYIYIYKPKLSPEHQTITKRFTFGSRGHSKLNRAEGLGASRNNTRQQWPLSSKQKLESGLWVRLYETSVFINRLRQITTLLSVSVGSNGDLLNH